MSRISRGASRRTAASRAGKDDVVGHKRQAEPGGGESDGPFGLCDVSHGSLGPEAGAAADLLDDAGGARGPGG